MRRNSWEKEACDKKKEPTIAVTNLHCTGVGVWSVGGGHAFEINNTGAQESDRQMPNIEGKTVNVGPTLFCAEINDNKLFADAPERIGGHGTAMTPPEALVATFANCIGLVIAISCRNKGIDYEGMTVEVSANVDADLHVVDDFEATVDMPCEMTDALKRCVEAAKEMCAIGKTLCVPSAVDIQLTE